MPQSEDCQLQIIRKVQKIFSNTDPIQSKKMMIGEDADPISCITSDNTRRFIRSEVKSNDNVVG